MPETPLKLTVHVRTDTAAEDITFDISSLYAANSCAPQPCYAGTVNAKKASIRVLFVDDHSATRDGYAAHLASCGFDVMAAATGREALTLAHSWAPSIIVLDLGLP